MTVTVSPIQKAVHSVFIHVSDLRRSAEWYSMVMGIPLLEERLNGGNVYWLMLEGGTGIILDDNKSNAPDAPHVLYSYMTDDIDAAHSFAQSLGDVRLLPIERPHPGLAYFNFIDPDGNAIMVTQSDYVSAVVNKLESADSPIANRIGGIFVHVTDMNRAINFHSRVLGLPYESVGEEQTIYDLIMAEGSNVLLDVNRHRNGEDYKALFMFDTKDIDASKAYLEANGITIFTDIERHGPIAFFTFKDPDGNVVMACSDDTVGK